MLRTATFVRMLVILTLVTSLANAEKKASSKDTQDSIVITFKDGHSQSFPVADVARIEFEAGAVSQTLSPSSGHFLGKWKVGDGMGGTFYITLKRDGEATKTMGGYHGTWKVIGDEARITWEDGWRDVIRKAGNRYEKAAFRPGRTFSDEPDHIADAASQDPI